MRVMYDAITPSRCPNNGDLYAGYVAGEWPSYEEMTIRFPKAIHVSIAVQADQTADVLDVERYDATPNQSVDWAIRMRAMNRIPTVYCNTSTWPIVRGEFRARGVDLPIWWAAQYDFVNTMYPGAIAKQYKNTPGYDVSVVASHWPGIDPPLQPLGGGISLGKNEDEMFIAQVNDATIPKGKGNVNPGAVLVVNGFAHPIHPGGSDGLDNVRMYLAAGAINTKLKMTWTEYCNLRKHN